MCERLLLQDASVQNDLVATRDRRESYLENVLFLNKGRGISTASALELWH